MLSQNVKKGGSNSILILEKLFFLFYLFFQVIVPSLGENVPDYYQLIDQTPGGHSADLNSGSFRAPEVFVCYRRGRDRPPLLDIGVLYDGKERLTPDSQVVEFTPNGHSANVNNTHNSAVYLTYKRATEVSPPNEKVVMDLCVIVTTKGMNIYILKFH